MFASGYVGHVRGDIPSAAAAFEQACGLAEEAGHSFYLSWAQLFRGAVYVAEGRQPDAIQVLEEAVEAARYTKCNHAGALVSLGRAYLHTGRISEARDYTDAGLRAAITRDERATQARGLEVLALIACQQGPAETAASLFHRALDLGTELGMRPLVAHCHAGLAKLHRRTGKPQQADEHFATATAMYREMGMMYWLGRLDREMSELGG